MKKCLICGKVLQGANWLIKKRIFCSNKCRGISLKGKHISVNTEIKKGKHLSRATQFKKGDNCREKHPNWKGGRWRMKNGYISILCPNHPTVMANNYVYEHILVAEKKYGRTILETESVHHINGKRDDNRPENLIVCKTFSEHMRSFHATRKHNNI